MPKARVLKSGWIWKGVTQHAGDVIDAPSVEWIANRVADGGLVEAIAEEVPAKVEIEGAVVEPSETSAFSFKKSKRSK